MAKHRSPSYPAIPLDAAVKLAERLYPAAKHALGAEVIAEQWGYKGINSASPYLAALKHFGLLSEEAGNGDRMLKLTERALDIAVDREGTSEERKAAIRDAALDPALHQELWSKWGGQLPPDGEIRRYLERERGFNPNHVAKFIEQFKATLAFSGLSGGDIIKAAEEKGNKGDQLPPPPPPKGRIQRTQSTMSTGLKEDVYSLSSGDAILQWPESITPDEYAELEGWLTLLLRKLKRSMGAAEVTMILGRGLTESEADRLRAIEMGLSAMFSKAGHPVRLCEGSGEAGNRKVSFVCGLVGPPLISIPSSRFLGTDEEQLLQELAKEVALL